MDSLSYSAQDGNPTKTCTKCKRNLPATTEYFKLAKRHKYGVYSQCKRCCSKREQRPDNVDINTKRCPACKEWLPFGNFFRSTSRPEGLNSWCKSCMQKEKAEKRKNTPHVPHLYRQYDLLRHRGISLQVYDQMFQEQGGALRSMSSTGNRNSPRIRRGKASGS